VLPSPALHPSVPIPTLLRPPVPQRIQLTAVPTGASRSGTAGRYAGAAGTVTARVEGDDAGLFAVVQLETDRPVRDPDAPPGHPPLIVLKTVQTVDGAGPIGVEPGEALLATVEFRCPADPRKDAYWAVVVLDGLTLPAPPGAGAAPAPGPAGRLDVLSARERTVLRLLAEGLTDRGIAERLEVSPRTVATYVQHVFTKLDLPDGPLDNRRVLAVLAFLDR
jgi:DNA-binding CsgD family transcriptional regulator